MELVKRMPSKTTPQDQVVGRRLRATDVQDSLEGLTLEMKGRSFSNFNKEQLEVVGKSRALLIACLFVQGFPCNAEMSTSANRSGIDSLTVSKSGTPGDSSARFAQYPLKQAGTAARCMEATPRSYRLLDRGHPSPQLHGGSD